MEQVVRRAQGPSADLLLSKVPRDADAGDVYDAEHGVATVDLPHWLIYGEKKHVDKSSSTKEHKEFIL